MTASAGIALAVGLAAGVAVGQTYVVDAAGGPGAQFTSIAAAATAVPGGAVLRVRSGAYGGFTVDGKSLAVFADPGVQVLDAAVQIVVRNLAPNQAVVLHGLQVGAWLGPAAITLQNNLGPVLLQRITSTTVSGAWLSATSCVDVQVVDCSFVSTQIHVVAASASRLALARSTLASSSGLIGGLRLLGAQAHFTDCTITGSGFAASYPVLQLDAASTVYLAGASTVGPGGPLPTWGVGPVGTVWLDPTVLIASSTPVGPGVALTVQSLPAVAAPAVPWGSLSTATLTVPGAGVGGLFVGLPAAPSVLPPFATAIALDTTTIVASAGGAGPVLSAAVVLPATPSLQGVRFGWQGWSYDAAGGWQASNAVVLAPW